MISLRRFYRFTQRRHERTSKRLADWNGVARQMCNRLNRPHLP